MTLAGRVALVTGASQGIGAAVASGLALAGARVVIVARSGEQLADVAAGLPGGALVMPADLSVAGTVDALVAAVQGHVGVPDIVVLNAGAFDLGLVGDLSLGSMDRMVDLNLRSPYRLLHYLIPMMRARGMGHVVTIGSIADHVAFPGNGAYALTKYGIRGLHEVVREELRGSGVRATLVSPGPVDTPIWDALHPESRPGFPARSEMLRPDDVADAVLWAVGRPLHVNVDEVRLGRS